MNKIAAMLFVALLAPFTSPPAQAVIIANWTFETSKPTTAGPFSPEVGSGSASGFHASTSVVYNSPSGNGSTNSFSSTRWSVGDYYQFQVSTLGLAGISVSWDQISSSTGPRDFDLEYSTDGINFSTFGSAYTVLVNASPNFWATNSTVNTTSFADDLSSITALNNAASVYFRLADISTTSASGGTVGTAGTDRVDNFVVAAVPEPSTYEICLLGGLGLLGSRVWRRRSEQLKPRAIET